MNSYAEKWENATLQYLADKFCEDNDFQYVELQTKKIGATHLPNITVGDNKSIFVKLNQYNYIIKK